MKLAEYLAVNGIKRTAFASKLGVSPGWITTLCDGTGWPSRDMAMRIREETGGAVTADDFLTATTTDPEPARAAS